MLTAELILLTTLGRDLSLAVSLAAPMPTLPEPRIIVFTTTMNEVQRSGSRLACLNANAAGRGIFWERGHCLSRAGEIGQGRKDAEDREPMSLFYQLGEKAFCSGSLKTDKLKSVTAR